MITPQFLLPIASELIVDLFAGGGGASTGIEQAIGRHVDIAINHDPEAVALHQANPRYLAVSLISSHHQLSSAVAPCEAYRIPQLRKNTALKTASARDRFDVCGTELKGNN